MVTPNLTASGLTELLSGGRAMQNVTLVGIDLGKRGGPVRSDSFFDF